jgi:hypothetical protein
MKQIRFSKILFSELLLFFLAGCATVTRNDETIKSVMDRVITQLYKTQTAQELTAIDYSRAMSLFSEEELQVLSTKHWMFDVNVPVVVSVMRSIKQETVPFWLTESGFVKTGQTMKNKMTTYEVWQKSFNTGRIGLGINGLENYSLHYFVSVATQNKIDQLELSHFFPENQYVSILDTGSFTYHDWDELVLTDVPESMKGQKLLTTIRGRGTESHLIGGFRTTNYPSSSKPDQIVLTWSSEPSESIDIQWRTDTLAASGKVIYRESGKSDIKEINAKNSRIEDRMLFNNRYINRFTAKLTNLKPGTSYQYLVGNQLEWSDKQSFTTSGNDDSFSFLWFGDTHYSSKFGDILKMAYKNHPDAAFFSVVGDLVSDGLYRNQWDELFKYTEGISSRIPFMAVPGNHDNRAGLGAILYQKLFSYPMNGPVNVPEEQTYSFTYENTLFLMIDATSPYDAHTQWIEKQLSTSKATWKIAMFHFPPYNSSEPYPAIQNLWVPLFDKYHVDFVFGGHVHYYMRSKPMKGGNVVDSHNKGTTYVISVAIPGQNHSLPHEPFAEVKNATGHLYQLVEIDGNSMKFNTFDINNRCIDSFHLKKFN